MSSAEQPTVVVTIGEIDVSEAIVKLNTSIATSQEGTATLFLNSAYPTLNDIDYTNLVTISAARGGTLHPIFTGDVASVHVSDEDQLVVECANMTAFREIALGHLEGKNCAADIVYSLARSAGLDDARIKMEGYGTPPLEEFQVVAPINGIDLQKEVRVSGILFRPARVGLPEICSQFDLTGEALDFTQGSAFAIALVPARKLHDAQEIGLAAIDDALSWLVVRSRYSSSVGPDGSLTSWSRSQMRFSPVRGRLVCVAGLTTTRAWLRSAEDTPILSALGMLDGAPIKQMDDSLALAFASCRRAAIADRYIERVAAIWEAVEYFVGDHKAPRLFSDGALKAIRGALSEISMDDEDSRCSQRLEELIGGLNNAPLMARFVAKLAADEISCPERDLKLLTRLRKVRNDASHGREATDPGREVVDRGVAVLARILVKAAHARNA